MAIRVSSQVILEPLVLEAKCLAEKNHISKNNWLQQQKERAERRKEKSAGQMVKLQAFISK